MIQYGIIEKIDYTTNRFLVRLPIFETNEDGRKIILEAVLCYQPGLYHGYNLGDVVVLGFINNHLDAPIILGKVFNGQEDSGLASTNAADLKITQKAELPLNSSIGNLTYSDLEEAVNFVKESKVEVNSLIKDYINEVLSK